MPPASTGLPDPRCPPAVGSVEQLAASNVQAVMRLEEEAKAGRTRSQRVAHAVAAFCGTMTFVWLHVAWFAVWIALNVIPGGAQFDKFPFTFLTLTVSLEAIFLSSFILISQNEETRVADRRNALDLQVNLLTEQENTKLLKMLAAIGAKLGVEFEGDPSLDVLQQATRPEALARQIDRAAGAKEG
ncbi:MAG: DUF1003 domain-containing protein [Burkholderiaceae bacterium]